MARWEPNTRTRLVVAAVDLSAEQGYDATTVAQIAERAGLTKATFFRHFPDKREVLFAGQEEHSALLAAGTRDAPSGASPLEAVAAGLARLSASFTLEQREFGPRLIATVAASPELQEREALKNAGLATAVRTALLDRGVPDTSAHLAAEMGILALRRGWGRWCAGDPDDGVELAEQTEAALDELRAAAAGLA